MVLKRRLSKSLKIYHIKDNLMNDQINAIAGVIAVVILLRAVGVTIVTFMTEAEAIQCKSLGAFIINNVLGTVLDNITI
jgi:hypothetical protein